MTMTESEVVRYEVVDRVAVVTLAAPESRNALSLELMFGLSDALSRAVEEGMGAVVLASSGRVWCSGGDLVAVRDAMDGDSDADVGAMVDGLHSVIRALRALPLPSIAAISGPAVGAGMALALATDVRIAGASAAFVTGYIAVGASPDGGCSYHLSRALGGPQALSSLLLNRRFGAQELEALGLVDVMVDGPDAVPSAIEHASRMSDLSMEAVTAMRDLVYAAPRRSLDEHLEAEKEQFMRIVHTAGFRSGVARFARPH